MGEEYYHIRLVTLGGVSVGKSAIFKVSIILILDVISLRSLVIEFRQITKNTEFHLVLFSLLYTTLKFL